MEAAVNARVIREPRERPDMRTAQSPRGLRIVQITTNPKVASGHIYMEAHVFTPDSTRFVYQRIRDASIADKDGPVLRNLMLCDVADRFACRQLTDEDGATAPSVSPDGRWMYYFVDGTRPGAGGRLTLKRCDLETFGRETLLVIEGNLPGTSHGISRVYPLSSISSDGKRLCTSAFFGDGKTKQAPWGVIVFDLETGAVRVACEGTELCNAHPQYSRSKDVNDSHDILVQANHGCEVDEFGRVVKLVGGAGADIHAVRDDGTKWRDFPWGRDGVEFCQGHQCWRGELTSAVTSLVIDPKSEECATRGPAPMVESRAHLADRAKGESHLGRTGKGRRNQITRKIPNANFCHFAFSGDGTRMTSDTCEFGGMDRRESTKLYIGTLPPGRISILRVKYLLHARTSFARNQYRHPHPFLSPDAARLFFNSDEGGQAQIWMAEGFEYPE